MEKVEERGWRDMTGLGWAVLISMAGLLALSLGANFEWYKESERRKKVKK